MLTNNIRIEWTDGEIVDTNLVDFIIENKDGCSYEEIIELCEALKKGERHVAGGGAVPEYSIGWAPAEKAEHLARDIVDRCSTAGDCAWTVQQAFIAEITKALSEGSPVDPGPKAIEDQLRRAGTGIRMLGTCLKGAGLSRAFEISEELLADIGKTLADYDQVGRRER